MNKMLKKMGIKEKYFDTGEVKLNYIVGPPTGTPIVFIPGQLLTWEEYTLLLPKLAHRFQVFAVSLRGHGKSTFTPNKYTFNVLGKDLTTFLHKVVGKPAIVVGNSSGGVLAVWLAANSPIWVKGVVCEDPPLFRCEWPNIKDTAVWNVFLMISELTGTPSGSSFLNNFKNIINLSGKQTKDVMNVIELPKSAENLISKTTRLLQRLQPIVLKFLPLITPIVRTMMRILKFIPGISTRTRILLKGFSRFDGTFSKAFAEGTVGKGFDHTTALSKITQPMLFLHANWNIYKGRLIGALTDDDVSRVKSLVKGSFKYVRLKCGHAIALEVPDQESKEIINWINSLCL